MTAEKKFKIQVEGTPKKRIIYIGFQDERGHKTIFKIDKCCRNCYIVESCGLKNNISKWFVKFADVKEIFKTIKEFKKGF